MNTPTDTYRELNVFRLFLRNYFYDQYQEIIERNLVKNFPPISSITWDPNNYEFKIVTTSKDYSKIDLDTIIQKSLRESFTEGDLRRKIITHGNESWVDIVNYSVLNTQISTLYRYSILHNSKTICVML